MLLSSAYLTKRWPRRSNSRSSSSSTRLLSRGESGPPCGVPSTLGLTSPPSITPDGHQEVSRFYLNIGVRQHPRLQECSYELQQPLVLYPFGDRTHQFVVVDSIEEFLQIEIHAPAVTFGDIPLRLCHCLLGA